MRSHGHFHASQARPRVPLKEIERAVRDIAAGQALRARRRATVLDYLSGTAPRQPTAFPQLSEREREVLALLAEGAATPT